MEIGSVGSILAGVGTTPEKPAKMKDAAQQFEAMLIAKLLTSATSPEEGEEGAMSTGQSGSAISDFAKQQVAQQISKQGGFGIANLLMRQYKDKL